MNERHGRTASPPWPGTTGEQAWTVGVEDEAMLVDGHDWSVANRIEEVLAALPAALAGRVSPETHACVIELKTGAHATVGDLTGELRGLRRTLQETVHERLGLRLAAAGTHPRAVPADVRVPSTSRQCDIAADMAWLAHREPTTALHVHVRVPDGDAAIRALDGLRGDVPLLLALAANSPFASGRDSGFASVRTPIFSAFPRTGIPRAFGTYARYRDVVDTMVGSGAVPDASHLWWDLRLQPRLGTVEVRVMDAQARAVDVGALTAVVQCLVYAYAQGAPRAAVPDELLRENRFRAARDGMRARLLAGGGRSRRARNVLEQVLDLCRPAAEALDCTDELADAEALAADPGDRRQRDVAARDGLAAVTASIADVFALVPERVGVA